MRPFAVLNAILFGSAAAITFGLFAVLIIYLVLQGRHPQLATEFGTLPSLTWILRDSNVALAGPR